MPKAKVKLELNSEDSPDETRVDAEPVLPENATEVVDNTDTTAAPEVQAVNETSKTEFNIIGEDGALIRTYSSEIHGVHAEALAKEFVSGHAGTKIE